MCQCELCKQNKADKKGSHIIPNFLIQSSFAENGKEGRGNEMIFPINIVSDFRFGRNVLPERIHEVIGRELKDEEIEKNVKTPIPYVKDYFLCTDCEKRLGGIETLYAESISKAHSKNDYLENPIPPHLSHLFWLSVIWRISVTNFGFKFQEAHIEEDIRDILNNTLSIKTDDIPNSGMYIERLKKYGYYLTRFEEDDIIKGMYAPPTKKQQTSVYPFLINNYAFIFTHQKIIDNGIDVNEIQCFGVENYLNKSKINNCNASEVIHVLNKDTFLKVLKRQALEHASNMEYELGLILSDFLGVKCPDEFINQVFFAYIAPIGNRTSTSKNASLILQTLDSNRLWSIIKATYEKWVSENRKPFLENIRLE